MQYVRGQNMSYSLEELFKSEEKLKESVYLEFDKRKKL